MGKGLSKTELIGVILLGVLIIVITGGAMLLRTCNGGGPPDHHPKIDVTDSASYSSETATSPGYSRKKSTKRVAAERKPPLNHLQDQNRHSLQQNVRILSSTPFLSIGTTGKSR